MSVRAHNLFKLRLLRAVVPICGLILMPMMATAQGEVVTIDRSVSVVESPEEPESVRRATDDLLGDFAKVLGQAPRRVQRLEDAGSVAILIAGQGKVPAGVECATTQATEAFAFSVTSARSDGASKRVVCLTGADARGTIYAIYQFSQSYLGIDPMYLWTDKMPARQTSIALPADFAHVFPSPVFRYRGFFPNDEDQLTGWIGVSQNEHSGISLKVWDNIFETILRLKGNMVVPGSWIFPDDAQVSAASKRGLIVNQHHASPLGVNAARWPKDVPYNLSTHPEIMERAWKNAVAAYKPDDQILWSVGLRGLSDQAYASLDPSVRNNGALLGQRISEAMTKQMEIVKARFPDAHFIANLWDEGIELEHKGYLKMPEEVTQVWADTGYGDMQDAGRLKPGQGMYFHVAMQNGEANQLSEMVPVSVIQEELGRYINAKATGFFLLNTSDIRAVAMTTQAAMETAWGGVPKSTANAETDWYRQWAAEQFGDRAADAVTAVYKAYFAAPIPVKDDEQESSANSTHVKREYGEQHYFTEATLLILNALSGGQVYRPIGQAPKWAAPRFIAPIKPDALQVRLAKDVRETDAAQLRWNHVWEQALAAEELVEPSRRNYYAAQVLTMIALNREGNRMLNHLAKAMQYQILGQQSKAGTEMVAALQPFETIHKYMAGAEYGKWKHWYRGDWLTNVSRTQSYVQDYANHLKDPFAALPAPMLWNDWEAYFHIMQYQGDRTVDVH